MHTNGAGYQVVNLDCGGKNSTRQVHRLILLAFVGEPPAGFQACHYPDSTRSNNRLENLRWDSVAENMKDKYRDSPISPTKKCTTCGTTKNRSDFYADVRNVDGIKAECKPCHTKTGMETRDPEKKRTNNRVWMRDVYRERNLSP
jgi:hypothetical protein